MNEQDQTRYEDLWEESKDNLVHRVIELENCMTSHDEEMQKMEAENHALKRKLEEMMYLKKRHVDRDWLAIYSPEYYLRTYADYSKQDLMLEIMDLRITLRGMFHD